MTPRILLALAIAALVAAAPAAAGSTPVPKTCPSKTLVASKLKQKVSKVTPKSTTSKKGKELSCTYTTTSVVATTIRFGSPVSAAAFAASKKAASKGTTVVTVKGIGDQAWAVKAGNGLSALKGTLDLVISAPGTTDAELEALAKKII
jgi:hypothetical protein